ncbi:MAG TPA: purine-binding chemotaxis protein CheW [bacterium]|nr:purine-binding chemotaxis protein CheW [bacterium]
MEKKIVGFQLREEEFAFDIMKVVEIIKLKEITEVPTAPSFVEGVINLRGKIVPIIDLRKRFNVDAGSRDKNYRIIIIEIEKKQIAGVMVDGVTKVMNAAEEQVLPPPAGVTETGGRYIEAIIKFGERIVVLLDPAKIFSEEEQEGLMKISQTVEGA